jgi:hypothetical protein
MRLANDPTVAIFARLGWLPISDITLLQWPLASPVNALEALLAAAALRHLSYLVRPAGFAHTGLGHAGSRGWGVRIEAWLLADAHQTFRTSRGAVCICVARHLKAFLAEVQGCLRSQAHPIARALVGVAAGRIGRQSLDAHEKTEYDGENGDKADGMPHMNLLTAVFLESM